MMLEQRGMQAGGWRGVGGGWMVVFLVVVSGRKGAARDCSSS